MPNGETCFHQQLPISLVCVIYKLRRHGVYDCSFLLSSSSILYPCKWILTKAFLNKIFDNLFSASVSGPVLHPETDLSAGFEPTDLDSFFEILAFLGHLYQDWFRWHLICWNDLAPWSWSIQQKDHWCLFFVIRHSYTRTCVCTHKHIHTERETIFSLRDLLQTKDPRI